MLKSLSVAAAVAVVCGFSGEARASASNVAACRAQASSYSQLILTPTGGGDEAFFTSPPGPPNVIFLLSVSRRMLNFPVPLPNPNGTVVLGTPDPTYVGGCQDTGYSGAPWTPVDMTSTPSAFDKDFKNEFNNGDFYYAWSNRVPLHNLSVSGLTDPDLGVHDDFKDWNHYNSNDACDATKWAQMLNLSDLDTLPGLVTLLTGSASTTGSCKWCLANKGWFRGPWVSETRGYAWALSGKLMNTTQVSLPSVAGIAKTGYQPKFAIARKVMKQLILNEQRVRLGVVLTAQSHSSNYMDYPQWFGGGGSALKPDCDKALNNTGFKNRTDLINYVQGTKFNSDINNVAESLFSIAGYYAGQSDWQNSKSPNDATGPGNFDFGGSDSSVAASWSPEVNNPNDPSMYHDGYPHSNDSYSWTDGNDTWTATGPSGQFYPSGGSKHESLCFSCQVSSVIILGDSYPIKDNSVPVTKLDGIDPGSQYASWSGYAGPKTIHPTNVTDPGGVYKTCLAACGGSAANILPDAGSSYNDGTFIPSKNYPDAGRPLTCVEKCDQGESGQGPQTGNKNFLDDVAYWMAHTDLRSAMPGKQDVRVYTVQLGGIETEPLLVATASAGSGQFYSAYNADDLTQQLHDAVTDIISQEFSGSVAAINSVDSAGSQAVYVPRFKPTGNRAFWSGNLQGFALYNEAVAKCTTDGGGGDLNQNKSCSDIYLIDETKSPIAADTQGIKDSDNPGKYYQMYSDGGLGNPANAYWDAEAVLESTGPASRQVWTIIDSDNNGTVDSADAPMRFDSSAATINALEGPGVDYLAIKNDQTFCDAFAAKSGITSIGTLADTGDYSDCAKYLIMYALGYDVLNERQDGTAPVTAALRQRQTVYSGGINGSGILGDIFHSSPVKLGIPLPEKLCAYDATCQPTLFAMTPTPIVFGDGGADAYQIWRSSLIAGGTPEYVVVGANDGMEHVFQANCWLAGDNPDTASVETAYLSPDRTLCTGTTKPGTEVLAFIPPDMLPMLKNLIGVQHTYFIDGSAMIRNIWVDANNDNIKQPTEFKSIAVMGERRGGTHYFALDLTDLAHSSSDIMHDANNNSRFRWMYPKLDDPNDLAMGETWNDYLPDPPPIGPIRYDIDSAGGTGLACSSTDHCTKYKETYVALLNGGYDPLNARGKGVFMLNAWDGSLIKEFSRNTPQGTSPDPINSMNYSFAAIPGMVNWPDTVKRNQANSDLDKFFNTGFAGDIGGQVWTFRFKDPNPAYWATGRAFQEVAGDGASDKRRFPFFTLPAAVETNTGVMRINVGTGDRQNLRDQGLGECSASNLHACIQEGCSAQVKVDYHVGVDEFQSSYSYNSTYTPTWTISYLATTASGNKCDAYSEVSDGVTGATIVDSSGNPVTAGVAIQCGTNSDFSAGDLVCPMAGNGVFTTQDQTFTDGGFGGCNESDMQDPSVDSNFDVTTISGSDTTWMKSRFISFALFDPVNTDRVPFNDKAGAAAYDAQRLTDFDTGAGGIAASRILVPALDDGGNSISNDTVGWVLSYPVYDERSSSTPESPAGTGCVFWNTVEGGHYCATVSDCCGPYADGGPMTNADCTALGMSCNAALNECDTISPCSGIGNSSKFSYNADVVTGAAGCGLAYNNPDGGVGTRRTTCTANCDLLPPPPPTPVVFIDSSGQVQTQLIGLPNGNAQATAISKTDDLVQDLYEILVPQNTHTCRHNAAGICY